MNAAGGKSQAHAIARRAGAAAFMALAASLSGACSMLTGLSDLEVVDCVQDCGETNGSDSSLPPADAQALEAALHDAISSDGTARFDGQIEVDASLSDADRDANPNPDAADDDGAAVDSGPADSGHLDSSAASDGQGAADSDSPDCGPLTQVTQCGACGRACDTSTASAAGCNGGTCSYTCKPGRSDCSQTAGNVDGCECATTGCCGDRCQTVHSNGLGQTYADCTDAGTINQNQALAACAAFSGSPNVCAVVNCGAGAQAVCSTLDLAACACWAFSGPFAGHAYDSGKGGLLGCVCPGTGSATWN